MDRNAMLCAISLLCALTGACAATSGKAPIASESARRGTRTEQPGASCESSMAPGHEAATHAIVTGQAFITDVAVNASRVYWAVDPDVPEPRGIVYSAAQDGRDVRTLASGMHPYALAVTNEQLYWMSLLTAIPGAPADAGDGAILNVAAEGGALRTLRTSTHMRCNMRVIRMPAADSILYWNSEGDISQLSLPSLDEHRHASHQLVGLDGRGAWLTAGRAPPRRVPAIISPVPVALSSDVAVTEEAIYWLDDQPYSPRLMKTDASGATVVLADLNTKEPNLARRFFLDTSLRVHGTHVYIVTTEQRLWVAHSTLRFDDGVTVLRVPLDGGPPETLARCSTPPFHHAGGMAMHGSSLYWADANAGTVFRTDFR